MWPSRLTKPWETQAWAKSILADRRGAGYVFLRSHAVILASRVLFSRFLFFIVCSLAWTVSLWCSSNMLPKNCCSCKAPRDGGSVQTHVSLTQKKATFMRRSKRILQMARAWGPGWVGRYAPGLGVPGETLPENRWGRPRLPGRVRGRPDAPGSGRFIYLIPRAMPQSTEQVLGNDPRKAYWIVYQTRGQRHGEIFSYFERNAATPKAQNWRLKSVPLQVFAFI